jgi:hypothetical protein
MDPEAACLLLGIHVDKDSTTKEEWKIDQLSLSG